MIKGKVKWFSKEKGYGFITLENGKDAFCHHSAIQVKSKDGKHLFDGEPVICEVVESPKGLQAQNVRRA